MHFKSLDSKVGARLKKCVKKGVKANKGQLTDFSAISKTNA
jgi:hypothetical protein